MVGLILRIPYVITVLFADFEKCHIIVNIGRFEPIFSLPMFKIVLR